MKSEEEIKEKLGNVSNNGEVWLYDRAVIETLVWVLGDKNDE